MALRLLNDVVSRDEYEVGHTSPLYSILFYSDSVEMSIGNPAIRIKNNDVIHQFSAGISDRNRQIKQKMKEKMIQTAKHRIVTTKSGGIIPVQSTIRRSCSRCGMLRVHFAKTGRRYESISSMYANDSVKTVTFF